MKVRAPVGTWLSRYAVFILEDRRWRFNADFDEATDALDEADWYVAQGYVVAVEPVPDDVRKYNWK